MLLLLPPLRVALLLLLVLELGPVLVPGVVPLLLLASRVLVAKRNKGAG